MSDNEDFDTALGGLAVGEPEDATTPVDDEAVADEPVADEPVADEHVAAPVTHDEPPVGDVEVVAEEDVLGVADAAATELAIQMGVDPCAANEQIVEAAKTGDTSGAVGPVTPVVTAGELDDEGRAIEMVPLST
jgi:hypothetical protein